MFKTEVHKKFNWMFHNKERLARVASPDGTCCYFLPEHSLSLRWFRLFMRQQAKNPYVLEKAMNSAQEPHACSQTAQPCMHWQTWGKLELQQDSTGLQVHMHKVWVLLTGDLRILIVCWQSKAKTLHINVQLCTLSLANNCTCVPQPLCHVL